MIRKNENDFDQLRTVPLSRIHGRKTLCILRAPVRCHAIILKKPSLRTEINDFKKLTEWRPLNCERLTQLTSIVLDEKSYWNGMPQYRRLPPIPGFEFQIDGESDTVNILVDLQNPGWEFFCGDERYSGFNFAGHSYMV